MAKKATDKIAAGWLPDPQDKRDYTVRDHAEEIWKHDDHDLISPKMDLSKLFTSARVQGGLPTCTAFAACGLLEWVAKRHPGLDDVAASPRFVYHAALQHRFRKARTKAADVRSVKLTAANAKGGLTSRDAYLALLREGTPPEDAWPYPADAARTNPKAWASLAETPGADVYKKANGVADMKAVRLDDPFDDNYTGATTLGHIRHFLWCELPCTVGFYYYNDVYARVAAVKKAKGKDPMRGMIPYPAAGDIRKTGKGHAVLIVGYDDNKEVPSAKPGVGPTKGAFLIRNSWGPWFTAKGCQPGHGWLPYAYIDATRGVPAGAKKAAARFPLARDVWSLLGSNYEDAIFEKKADGLLRDVPKDQRAKVLEEMKNVEGGVLWWFIKMMSEEAYKADRGG